MGGDRVAISGIPGISSSTMDVAMPATSFKVRITSLFVCVKNMCNLGIFSWFNS